MKILVFDDEPLRQNWFADVFLNLYPNWNLFQAYNGIQALTACSAIEFDLAFFDHDLGMDTLDGSQIAYKLLSESVYKLPKRVWIHSNNGEDLAISQRLWGPLEFRCGPW